MAFPFLQRVQTQLEDYFRPEQIGKVSPETTAFMPKAPTSPSIGRTIKGLVSQVGDSLGNALRDFSGGRTYAADFRTPTPTASPTPTPQARITPQAIEQGLSRFGSNVPIATASGQLAQAGTQLPENIDPYLPVIMALMETGGGRNQVGTNNAYNLRGLQDGQRKFVDYPDLATAILGGDNQGVPAQGFLGTIMNNPAYANFRESGRLEDFFPAYTPPGAQYGNPSLEELVTRYLVLRELFE